MFPNSKFPGGKRNEKLSKQIYDFIVLVVRFYAGAGRLRRQ
jgi:hypothetical protein